MLSVIRLIWATRVNHQLGEHERVRTRPGSFPFPFFIILVAGLALPQTQASAGTVVYAWGRGGDAGQTAVPGDATNIITIAVGYSHALAVKSDGTVEAWGQAFLGATSVPSGLSNVVAIAGGDNHSLALKNDGTVVGWGDNIYGEANVPSGLTNVVAISAGVFFSLALKSDGTVTGWGYNGNSQLYEAAMPGTSWPLRPTPSITDMRCGSRQPEVSSNGGSPFLRYRRD